MVLPMGPTSIEDFQRFTMPLLKTAGTSFKHQRCIRCYQVEGAQHRQNWLYCPNACPSCPEYAQHYGEVCPLLYKTTIGQREWWIAHNGTGGPPSAAVTAIGGGHQMVLAWSEGMRGAHSQYTTGANQFSFSALSTTDERGRGLERRQPTHPQRDNIFTTLHPSTAQYGAIVKRERESSYALDNYPNNHRRLSRSRSPERERERDGRYRERFYDPIARQRDRDTEFRHPDHIQRSLVKRNYLGLEYLRSSSESEQDPGHTTQALVTIAPIKPRLSDLTVDRIEQLRQKVLQKRDNLDKIRNYISEEVILPGQTDLDDILKVVELLERRDLADFMRPLDSIWPEILPKSDVIGFILSLRQLRPTMEWLNYQALALEALKGLYTDCNIKNTPKQTSTLEGEQGRTRF